MGHVVIGSAFGMLQWGHSLRPSIMLIPTCSGDGLGLAFMILSCSWLEHPSAVRIQQSLHELTSTNLIEEKMQVNDSTCRVHQHMAIAERLPRAVSNIDVSSHIEAWADSRCEDLLSCPWISCPQFPLKFLLLLRLIIHCSSLAKTIYDMFLQSGRPDSAGYTSLESKESTGSSPSCSEEALHIWEERSLRSTFTTAAYGLGIAAALVAGLMLGRLQTHAMTDREMTLKVSQNSPMLEDIDIDYKVVRFDGSFLNENIFRQDASPRVDAAWESLGVDYRPLAVPEHLAEKVGLDPDQVKINAKYGGGYPANVEGLHHLHCLVRTSIKPCASWLMSFRTCYAKLYTTTTTITML